ncbi:MAG: hypothetical protein ACR2GU_02995 [Rubrobacteraceae bacterium]
MSHPGMRFERSNVGWVLCLNCAAVFEAAQSETYICPNCDYEFDLETLLNRPKLASNAVHFGYQYRTVYEGEHEEGPRAHYSLLLLHEIVEWVALAVISGLIGGASTELAKRAIAKLRKQVAEEPELRDLDEAKLVLDEEEFKKLTLYVVDFLNGMENVPQEVKVSIIEEMLVNRAVEILARRDKAEELGDLRQPRARRLEAAKELQEEDLVGQADFENMWKDIQHKA